MTSNKQKRLMLGIFIALILLALGTLGYLNRQHAKLNQRLNAISVPKQKVAQQATSQKTVHKYTQLTKNSLQRYLQGEQVTTTDAVARDLNMLFVTPDKPQPTEATTVAQRRDYFNGFTYDIVQIGVTAKPPIQVLVQLHIRYQGQDANTPANTAQLRFDAKGRISGVKTSTVTNLAAEGAE
ncbi:MAG: hypothetical protein LKF36_07850 [Lactobacillus sp.]|jgi:hypothetical protein|nr:hypothetical protein [Lactobacillus sp.]